MCPSPRLKAAAAVLFGISLWLASGASHAQVHIRGAGVITCATWLQQRAERSSQEAAAWALGFLSGAAIFGAGGGRDFLAVHSWASIGPWLDDYCRSQPGTALPEALKAFIDAHSERS